MDLFQPTGPVQHSGTFNAHLVPVLGGLAFLEEAAKETFFPHLQRLERRFHDGIDSIIRARDLNMVAPRHGARFSIVLGRRTPPQRYEDTFCHDASLMLQLIRGCWERNVYFHDYGGGAVHHGYSVQHSNEDIDTVLSVLDDVLASLKNELAETGMAAQSRA